MQVSSTCMGVFKFDKRNREIFERIIKPLVESHTGLKYIDAASYYEPTAIKMSLISRMIKEARLVIISLSEKNPNVFIELGIAYVLNKPMVLICSEDSWEGRRKEQWNKKMPFDIEGRELLIFKDENDLKVKLGRFISDSLYKTKERAISWWSQKKDNHIKSPSEIEIFKDGAIWSDSGLHNNFIVSYHVKIHGLNVSDRNPDVRLYFSGTVNGYPRIVNIFPWEFSEIDTLKYECHIDYFASESSHIRLQQVSVGDRNVDLVKDFDVFVSFCFPNLVFESSFFENKVNRLIVSMTDLRNKGYPVHVPQYIGLESVNSRATISEIRVKEVFV